MGTNAARYNTYACNVQRQPHLYEENAKCNITNKPHCTKIVTEAFECRALYDEK